MREDNNVNLYYVVINSGDGSVDLTWFESQSLADWVDKQGEGWSEGAVGCISLESSSPITHNLIVETKESWLVELLENEDNNAINFMNEFFDSCPQITASPNGQRHNIYFDGELVHNVWSSTNTQQDADDLAIFYNESLRST